MLFLLLTAQRCQTLHLIEIQDIEVTKNSCTIHPTHLLKQSKPGHHLEPIVLQKYDKSPNQCIVRTLAEYVKRTEVLRGTEKKLLIRTQRPRS